MRRFMHGATLLACLSAFVLAGCSSDEIEGPAPNTLTDASLPVDTADGAPTVIADFDDGQETAGRIVGEVDRVVGADFSDVQRECAQTSIAALATDVLERYTESTSLIGMLDGDLDLIFSAIDGCVSPADYAGINAPSMEEFGVPTNVALCVQSFLRAELGFKGLWQAGAAASELVDEEVDVNSIIAGVYERCDFDPATVTVATEA